MRYIKYLRGDCYPVPNAPSIYKTKNQAQVGDIIVQGKKIVSVKNYSKQDLPAIGIVFMTTKQTEDGKLRYVSLDYMNPDTPIEGSNSTSNIPFGGYVYDPNQTVNPYDGGDWSTNGYGYPNYNTLVDQGWEVKNGYPVADDMINISSTSTHVFGPSVNLGNVEGPTEASIFKYDRTGSNVPVPYFNNGNLNPSFRTNSFSVPGTSTIVNFSNALSDVNGKENCDVILNYIKNSGHDNTITIINDNTSTGYEFPAVMCCHLYNKGDVEWYLPAMGELAYIYAHFNLINEARNFLGLSSLTKDWYWSSSLMGKDGNGNAYAGNLGFNNGIFIRYYFNDSGVVLAVSNF